MCYIVKDKDALYNITDKALWYGYHEAIRGLGGHGGFPCTPPPSSRGADLEPQAWSLVLATTIHHGLFLLSSSPLLSCSLHPQRPHSFVVSIPN